MSDIAFETAVKQEEAYLRKVHPTPDDIPGCMKLFDDFLSCNSAFMFKSAMLHLLNVHARYHLRSVVGKQLTSLYRYGHMSVCGPKLEEFKFCMSLKGLHPEERRDAWIRRRAEWWAQRRLTKSSEDIWDIRT